MLLRVPGLLFFKKPRIEKIKITKLHIFQKEEEKKKIWDY
tara:strand:- start:1939 stop:2058 length:120 start_codon:yes stop_codon:yes gene_type:complete